MTKSYALSRLVVWWVMRKPKRKMKLAKELMQEAAQMLQHPELEDWWPSRVSELHAKVEQLHKEIEAEMDRIEEMFGID